MSYSTLVEYEPRVRHTKRCDEARASGHPGASCTCNELERLHDDWRALSATIKVAKDYVPAVILPDFAGLLGLARSRAALDDLHDRIKESLYYWELFEKEMYDLAVCPICRREEDGP